LKLREIGQNKSWIWTSPTDARAGYLLHKLEESVQKIESLESANSKLKKILAKGG
jgi:hypothetical protein